MMECQYPMVCLNPLFGRWYILESGSLLWGRCLLYIYCQSDTIEFPSYFLSLVWDVCAGGPLDDIQAYLMIWKLVLPSLIQKGLMHCSYHTDLECRILP